MVIIFLLFHVLNICSASVLPEKDPVGIANCGASCYMNSVLQALITMNLFSEFLQSKSYAYKPESITQSLITILEIYKNSVEELSFDVAEPFYSKISKLFGTAKQQEDASEFWDLLYQQIIDKDIADLREKAGIIDYIEKLIGIQEIQSTLNESGRMIESQYILPKLMIDIHSHEELRYITNLQEGFSQEIVEERGSSTYTKTPQGAYLILGLKIFGQNELGEQIKIDSKVRIDEELHPTNGIYKCIALVCHYGQNLSSGHYVSFVKRNSGWFLCDDTIIKSVGNFQQMLTVMQMGKNDPYLLIFAKESYKPHPAKPDQIPPLAIIDQMWLKTFFNDLSVLELLLRK